MRNQVVTCLGKQAYYTTVLCDNLRKASIIREMLQWNNHSILQLMLIILFAHLCITQAYGATLTVITSGTGQGSVYSSPPGIACPGTCSGTFTTFSLFSNPVINSLFRGWGGACEGMEDCTFTLNRDLTVNAFFDLKSTPIRVIGSNYGALQTAYNNVAPGGEVQVVAKSQSGALTLDKDISFTLTGGYDDAFSSNTGNNTKLHGTLLIKEGSLRVKCLLLAPSLAPSQSSPPSAPSGLIAVAGNSQVTINWDAVLGASSYNVYYSTSTGVTRSSGIKVTGATSGQTVSGLINTTTYYFLVTAVNANGESIESSQVIAAPAKQAPSIVSLSMISADPTNLLTITGVGFDPTATLSVRFFDTNGFILDVPILVADPTSITVSVPPYINPVTGLFGAGIVNVEVIQNYGGSIVTSNAIQNFQLQNLPVSNAPPGAVTLNILYGIINNYTQLQTDLQNTVLDIPELNTAIANSLDRLQTLATQVRTVFQNTSVTFSPGSIHGTNISVGAQALLETDRMIISLFSTLSTDTSASLFVNAMNKSLSKSIKYQQAAIPCQQEANAVTNFMLFNVGDQVENTSGYNRYTGCSSGGLPVAVKTTNEVIGGAGTLFVALFGLAGAPAAALALPAAALFNIEVMSIVIQVNVAAALKNIDNSESYKAIHQAVDQIEDNLRGMITGKIIPETAGTLKDIFNSVKSLYQAFGNTTTLFPALIPTLFGQHANRTIDRQER